ncbi:MAG: hypothetical protein JWQ38_386 [Flavipsychrobacter sp.]|nr:hypothetical protein [Flavipsychrobacter sp.]
MSHDTHHGQPKENKTIISFKNSFWLVVIIVGLFVAALNFIQAESGAEHEGKGEAKETSEMNAAETQKEGHTQAKPEEHPTAAPEAAHTDSTAKKAE